MKPKGSKLILFSFPFLSYYQYQIKERRVTGSIICNRQRSITTAVAGEVMNENRCIFCQEPIPEGKQICLICELSLDELDLSTFKKISDKKLKRKRWRISVRHEPAASVYPEI